MGIGPRLSSISFVALTWAFLVAPGYAFTITQDPGAVPSAPRTVGLTTYTVSLDPLPTTALAAGATADFRTLLDDTFDGIDASGSPDNTVDWNFVAGAAMAGSVTIAQYDAYTLDNTHPTCPNCGGAIMDLSFNGAGAPTNLQWIQIIDTTHPLGGASNPYVDPRPNDDNLPFYFTSNEMANGFVWQTPTGSSAAFSNPGNPRVIQNPDADTDLVFLDASRRGLSQAPVDWDAYLYLVSWDGTFGGTVTIHDGLRWGFTIVPEPSTALLLGLGLVGLCAHQRRSRQLDG